MSQINEFLDKIICGDALDVLKEIPSNSIDTIITSPPYWGLRNYGKEAYKIWGGDPNCKHEWITEIAKHDNLRPSKVSEKTIVGSNKELRFRTGEKVENAFCIKCGAWYGQLGLEPNPEMFIEHLIEIFREVKRVLKSYGNVFIVIDDTYSGGGYGGIRKNGKLKDTKYGIGREFCPVVNWSNIYIPKKSLCLIPERFVIQMVDKLGFILRQKLIWAKKVLIYKEMETFGNAMPESVKDRNTHTFEFVYHFVKESKYYYDQLRLPYKEESIERIERTRKLIRRTGLPFSPKNKYYQAILDKETDKVGQAGALTGRYMNKFVNTNLEEYGNVLPSPHPEGANAPDVIQINTEAFPDAHFAVFPERLVEFLIKVGCPEQVCKKCGKPRERIVKPTGRYITLGGYGSKTADYIGASPTSSLRTKKVKEKQTIGWSDCGCNTGWRPGIVLDPFCGSGTTCVVAKKLGRHYIGIDINPEYCKMAQRRLNFGEKLEKFVDIY